jgi:hypothetical protein
MADETLEAELAEALRRRLAVIGDNASRERDPSDHLVQLRKVSEQIASLQSRLPPDTNPQLRHFFERCSYDKALAWLDQSGAS